MQAICTSLQTDNHTNTSSLNFYSPYGLPGAQPMVSKHWKHTVSCFSKIKIGFTVLVSAHPGSPGQRAINCVCVACDSTSAELYLWSMFLVVTLLKAFCGWWPACSLDGSLSLYDGVFYTLIISSFVNLCSWAFVGFRWWKKQAEATGKKATTCGTDRTQVSHSSCPWK